MPHLPPALREIIAQVATGTLSVADAIAALEVTGTENGPEQMQPIVGATVDLGRQQRCGFGEVIFGEGKNPDLIGRIIDTQIAAGQTALVTRLDPAAAESLRSRFPTGHHHPIAKTFRVPCPAPENFSDLPFRVAVITAGSTDAPVGEEAIETLAWMRIPAERFEDIGVAGPQRLLAAVPRLRKASAVVVVAGMEGALPAAVAGHLSCPIFAVPTSVGYGATLGGLTPLLGMLSSCAANVAVVNIDAGFKGGYLAGIVVRQLQQSFAEAQRSCHPPAPK
ncbi:nickel pincer cofactor biosynthesis protein LarB [Novipirellula artificiosorum]|uniref:AIR carboxylase n=1 Tax=Novipirellula artificiosorum TaxID=2528016 RepID=A0A5C6DZU8_9BACT|nr:nickel pincer cofactor biosynthesis protein LarB [Novipirellula artificiosorum]TWU42168.1 AIR carboxylase [Novipirellula artificiosorum]